jgi:hypothetical protein
MMTQMIMLAVLGGLGASEILIILIILVLAGFGIIFPILLLQERRRRKYWQTKAEDYEKRLIDKK